MTLADERRLRKAGRPSLLAQVAAVEAEKAAREYAALSPRAGGPPSSMLLLPGLSQLRSAAAAKQAADEAAEAEEGDVLLSPAAAADGGEYDRQVAAYYDTMASFMTPSGTATPTK